MKNRGKFRFKRGPDPEFSLIELLVVIAYAQQSSRRLLSQARRVWQLVGHPCRRGGT